MTLIVVKTHGLTIYTHRTFHNALRDYKIYFKKSVADVFTKPLQIEGTNENPPPINLLFVIVNISAARRCECT